VRRYEQALIWRALEITSGNQGKDDKEILKIEMHLEAMMGSEMAFFPSEDGVGGAVVSGDGYEPNDKGSLVYLNAGEDLSAALSRVEKAGGKVIVPKTQISPEIGHFALFIDTEGNKVALHSPK